MITKDAKAHSYRALQGLWQCIKSDWLSQSGQAGNIARWG